MKTLKKRRLMDYLRYHHNRNRQKGVYGYMWWTAIKIILIYLVTILPVILLLKRFVDLTAVFNFITDNLTDTFVFVVFTLSESFLGMIPPDLFVIWAGKFDHTMLLLVILGILSYFGGVISYFIGSWLSQRKRIKEYSERALEKYIKMVRKWGGAFIVIAALFPYSPFSMVVIAVSLLRYPLKLYLFFGIARILRFVIQGIFYLHILDLEKLFG